MGLFGSKGSTATKDRNAADRQSGAAGSAGEVRSVNKHPLVIDARAALVRAQVDHAAVDAEIRALLNVVNGDEAERQRDRAAAFLRGEDELDDLATNQRAPRLTELRRQRTILRQAIEQGQRAVLEAINAAGREVAAARRAEYDQLNSTFLTALIEAALAQEAIDRFREEFEAGGTCEISTYLPVFRLREFDVVLDDSSRLAYVIRDAILSGTISLRELPKHWIRGVIEVAAREANRSE